MTVNNTPTGMHMTRPMEWMLSLCMLALGYGLVRPEVYFDLPIYKVMAAIMSETRWGALMIALACLRMIGLGINGWWRRTPIIRFLGAFLGGLLWLAVWFLMNAGASIDHARLPAGMYLYVAFFVGEGWAALATGYDMNKNSSLSLGAPTRNVR